MTEEREGGSRPNKKIRLIFSAIILLVAAILLPPLVNVSRHQHRIASSISASIGRPVHISDVKLRLLPRPGFVISDFVIADDPAFGNEPLLRAPSVVAYVRLWSLWKGQLDVDRISLDEANLNVIRTPDGKWNLGSLLLKASQAPVSPTGQAVTKDRPRFPYIAASNSRINFKNGIEKLPFSFLNADLSVWLENPDEWRMSFEAQPVRTDLDLDLADTGTVRLEGSFHRASELRQVPMQIKGEWEKAQIGQLTRLLLGRDTGWRGDMNLQTTITGTGENARISTRLSGNSLHRTEFEPVAPLDFDAFCTAQYLHSEKAVRDIACNSPIGKGRISIKAKVEGLWDEVLPAAHVAMTEVPAEAVLDVMRTMRSDFAPGIKVAGALGGELDYEAVAANNGPGNLKGELSATGIQFTGGALKTPITLPALTLSASTTEDEEEGRTVPALAISPFTLDAGEAQPLKMNGVIANAGFVLNVNGPAKIEKLLEYTQAFGLSRNTLSSNLSGGDATLALAIHSPWVTPMYDLDHPMATDLLNGTISVKGTQLKAGFLANPVEIAQAKAVFDGDEVSWQQADITYGSLKTSADLSYRMPCSTDACVLNFHAHFGSVDAETVQAALLGAKKRGTLVKELLDRLERNKRMPWPKVEGTIDAQTLTVDRLALHDAHATVTVEGTDIELHSLDAHALGGNAHLSGTIKTGGDKPQYALEVDFNHANAAEAGDLFHEKWGAGKLNFSTKLNLTGYTKPELLASAEGTSSWDWTRGAMTMEGTGNLLSHFDQWTGEGALGKNVLAIKKSEVKKGKQAQEVSGSIDFSGPKFTLTSGH